MSLRHNERMLARFYVQPLGLESSTLPLLSPSMVLATKILDCWYDFATKILAGMTLQGSR